jgi:hypothetical protein
LNKQGQIFVAKNIVQLLLVIGSIVFLVTCASKTVDLFMGNSGTLSERTYLVFVEEILDLSDSKEILKNERSELFLEDGEGVVYFEKLQNKMTVFVDGTLKASVKSGTKNKYLVTINRPSSCDDSACLCFFKEKKIETITDIDEISILGPLFFDLETAAFIDLISPNCEKLEKPVKISTCSYGIPNDGRPYVCKHGFIIERHVMKEVEESFITSYLFVDIYYTTPKNLVLTLTNQKDGILISPRGSENEGS